MNVLIRVVSILGFVLLAMLADACKAQRCPLDNCHIRMRHRHPSMMGGGKGESAPLVYDANAGPESNLGPVYRGIPWWQFYRETKVQPGAKNYKTVKTRDPKIGQGYKAGYKYKHKDNKPWSERMKKYKKKKIEDEEKANRKAEKNGQNVEEEGSQEENIEQDVKEKDTDIKMVGEKAKPVDENNDTPEEEEAPKKAKKEKKQKAEKPKKEKKAKKKKEAPAEEPEEKEEEGF